VSAPSVFNRRWRVLGDQATIKDAWFKAASATGAKSATAAAMAINLVIFVSLFGVAKLSAPLMPLT
jgi:hypothetical protein